MRSDASPMGILFNIDVKQNSEIDCFYQTEFIIDSNPFKFLFHSFGADVGYIRVSDMPRLLASRFRWVSICGEIHESVIWFAMEKASERDVRTLRLFIVVVWSHRMTRTYCMSR